MSIPRPNPYLEIDWRSRRCEDLIEHDERPSRSRDDHWTWRAWRFFCALGRGDDKHRRERVRHRHPHLAAAVELRQSDDPFRRWEVESRILARESPAAIAVKSRLTPEAVEAYTRLYFDVAGSLDAADWIVLYVIRFTPSRTVTEDDAETFLKLYAYFGGSYVLDSLLDFFRNPEPVPGVLDDIEPARLPRVTQHLFIRAAIAARCAPVGDPRPAELLLLAERLQAMIDDGVRLADQDPAASLRRAGEQDHHAVLAEPVLRQRRAG